MKKVLKSVVSMFLCLIVVLPCFIAVSATGDAKTSDIKGELLSNDFLEIAINNNNGRFTIGTTGGNPDIDSDNNKKLLYGHPNPSTSYTTISIDGNRHIFGDEGLTIAPALDLENMLTSSTDTYENINIKQTLQLVSNVSTGRQDVVEIKYEITNNDTVSHNVGTRIMLDTMLGNNDSAPFRVPGIGNVTTQRELTGNNIPQYWQAFDDLEDTKVVSQGSLLRSSENKPDKVQFTNWNSVYNTSWEAPINSGSSNGDSAVTVTWYEENLDAGETRTYITHYGLSELLQDLRPPLAVSVYGDNSVTLKPFWFWNEDPYEPNPITITAYIKNIGNWEASNVYAYLRLPTCMSVVNGDNRIEFDSLGINEEKQVSWDIKIEPLGMTFVFPISIIIGADDIEEKTIIKNFTIPGANKDNRIKFGRDNFSFLNSPNAFVSETNMVNATEGIWTETHNLSSGYLEKLLAGMSDNVRRTITNQKNSTWGGSCYGMSNVVALMRDGSLTPEYWQDRAKKTYDLKKPVDNAKIRDLINFYQLTFFLPDIRDLEYNFYVNTTQIDDFVYDDSNLIRQLISETEKVKKGGLPVNLCYGAMRNDNAPYGHSILAYEVDDGNYTAENGIKYKYRVSVCDPNINEKKYLYVSEDFQNWYYDPIGNDRKFAYLVINDYTTIDIINPERDYNRTNLKEYNANFILNFSAESMVVSNNGIQGVVYGNATSHNSWDEPVYGGLSIPFPVQNGNPYIITPKTPGGIINSSMVYEHSCLTGYAKSGNSLEFKPESQEVVLDMNNSEYEVSLTFNEGYCSLPWACVEVEGKNSNSVSLKQVDEGMLLKSDNLINTTVDVYRSEDFAYNCGSIVLTLSTSKDSVLLKAIDENTLGAYVDDDNDGIYETLISDSSGNMGTSALLKDLKILETELKPLFNPNRFEYKVFVDNAVSSISIVPTMYDNTIASMSINGSVDTSLSGLVQVPLDVGQNTIVITVSSENLTDSQYTIKIERAKEPLPPKTSDKSNIVLTAILLGIPAILGSGLFIFRRLQLKGKTD